MLKHLHRLFLVGIFTVFILVASPAWANSDSGDPVKGAQIFTANCAACHAGGNNVINGAKTLKKDALAKYEMNSFEAIKYQVVHGKNAMPAFQGRLSEAQIEDVTAYVLSQAEQGW